MPSLAEDCSSTCFCSVLARKHSESSFPSPTSINLHHLSHLVPSPHSLPLQSRYSTTSLSRFLHHRPQSRPSLSPTTMPSTTSLFDGTLSELSARCPANSTVTPHFKFHSSYLVLEARTCRICTFTTIRIHRYVHHRLRRCRLCTVSYHSETETKRYSPVIRCWACGKSQLCNPLGVLGCCRGGCRKRFGGEDVVTWEQLMVKPREEVGVKALVIAWK